MRRQYEKMWIILAIEVLFILFQNLLLISSLLFFNVTLSNVVFTRLCRYSVNVGWNRILIILKLLFGVESNVCNIPCAMKFVITTLQRSH